MSVMEVPEELHIKLPDNSQKELIEIKEWAEKNLGFSKTTPVVLHIIHAFYAEKVRGAKK